MDEGMVNTMKTDISRGINTQELKAHIILSGQRAKAAARSESPELGETQGASLYFLRVLFSTLDLVICTII